LSWRIDENQEEKNDRLRRWYEESQVEAKAGEAQQAEELVDRAERKREKARACQQRHHDRIKNTRPVKTKKLKSINEV
jgi:hypothetical protein